MEARTLMLASNNVLFPANGEPSIVPSQDVVLGLYHATRERINGKGGDGFADTGEVERARTRCGCGTHQRQRAADRVRQNKETGEFTPVFRPVVNTTVGRALLFEILPAGLAVQCPEQGAEEKEIPPDQRFVPQVGLKETAVFADRCCKTVSLATGRAFPIAIDDMLVPRKAGIIIGRAERGERNRSSTLRSGDLRRTLQQGG